MRKRKNAVRDDEELNRSMINIELSPEAQGAVNDACKRAGMKKRELVARVLRWFADQDDEIRALVLGSTSGPRLSVKKAPPGNPKRSCTTDRSTSTPTFRSCSPSPRCRAW